jgi:hypothetical protein
MKQRLPLLTVIVPSTVWLSRVRIFGTEQSLGAAAADPATAKNKHAAVKIRPIVNPPL